MITEKDLEDNGYRKYPLPPIKPDAYGLWQKVHRLNNGKKAFFINFYGWELPNWIHQCVPSFTVGSRLYAVPTGNFGRHHSSIAPEFNTPISFEVDLIIEEWMTVEYIERFYWDVYESLDGIPDIHNND